VASAQGGSVTAEVAIALPAVVLALVVVLAVGAAVSAQLRCVDAARAGARAAARGQPPAEVSAFARRIAPAGARVGIDLTGNTATVSVLATLRLPLPGHPGLTVRARALADVEHAADRGSGTLLMLAPVTVGLLLAATLGGYGQAVLARHRAETSADLAALAAAALWDAGRAGACPAALRVAGANGGRLLACRPDGDGTVRVTVAVPLGGPAAPWGPAVARARAGPAPPGRTAGS
jgi:secretion/DNA translocation related TadE-like protein